MDKKVEIDYLTLKSMGDQQEARIKELGTEIKVLENRKQNLESQKLDQVKRDESWEKNKELELIKKFHAKELALHQREMGLEQRLGYVVKMEEHIKEREAMVVTREQDIVKIHDMQKKFTQEILDMNTIREEFKREVERAKAIIGEAQAVQAGLDAQRAEIAGREISVKKQEREWHDRIGEVEQREKELRVKTLYCEKLKEGKDGGQGSGGFAEFGSVAGGDKDIIKECGTEELRAGTDSAGV